MLVAVAVTPLFAAGAVAGTGVDEVAFDPASPDWRKLTVTWDARQGDSVSAAQFVDDLRIVLPPELVEISPERMSYSVRGATTFDDAGSWGFTGTHTAVSGVLAFDLSQAMEEIKGTRLNWPTKLLISLSSHDEEAFGEGGFLDVSIWVDLAIGTSAPEQTVQLAYPQGPGAVTDQRGYVTEPATAGFGTSLVVEAVEGFWTGPSHVEVVANPGNYQHGDGTIDADGRRLTITVPERWSPGVGELDRIVLRPGLPLNFDETIIIPIVQASSDPVAAYVTSVYWDLFGRVPDPTGLTGWTAALEAGRPYGAVADGITYSREFRAGLITDAYHQYLGREPDSAGLMGWLDAMDRGLHIQNMEVGFLASQEYYAGAGGNDEAWVGSLYVDVLGRGADPAETRAWVGVLQRLGRVEVARQFLYSTEYLETVVDGYYWWLLGRGIDPVGSHGWVAAIQAGARSEAIVAGIIASTEYRGRVPVSS